MIIFEGRKQQVHRSLIHMQCCLSWLSVLAVLSGWSDVLIVEGCQQQALCFLSHMPCCHLSRQNVINTHLTLRIMVLLHVPFRYSFKSNA